MRASVLLFFIVTILGMSSSAQEKCGFGGDENFKKTENLLTQAKSCKEAAATLRECMWGSSADHMFASIAIPKCEEEFRTKLTIAAAKRYDQEMGLCGLEYAKQSGTMSISAAAMCEVDIAAGYASTSSRWTGKPIRASFDCSKAQSKIEKTICSDQELGNADIVLSRVYSNNLKMKGFTLSVTLRNDQRAWLKRLPATCNVTSPFSEVLSKCLLREYETRYSVIDACTEGAINEDSWSAKQYRECLNNTSILRD